MKRLLFTCIVMWGLSKGLGAICLVVPLSRLVADPAVALVARARVAQLAVAQGGQIVTLQIIRVWKGTPESSVVVYNRLNSDPRQEDVPQPFEVGKEYLVTAYLLTPSERELFGVSGSAEPILGITEGARSCTTAPFDSPLVQRLLEGAPGRH